MMAEEGRHPMVEQTGAILEHGPEDWQIAQQDDSGRGEDRAWRQVEV